MRDQRCLRGAPLNDRERWSNAGARRVPDNQVAPDLAAGGTRPGVGWNSAQHREGGPAMVGAIDDLLVEALFVSYLQPSDAPPTEAVHRVITETIMRFGTDGCVARVAAAFG